MAAARASLHDPHQKRRNDGPFVLAPSSVLEFTELERGLIATRLILILFPKR